MVLSLRHRRMMGAGQARGCPWPRGLRSSNTSDRSCGAWGCREAAAAPVQPPAAAPGLGPPAPSCTLHTQPPGTPPAAPTAPFRAGAGAGGSFPRRRAKQSAEHRRAEPPLSAGAAVTGNPAPATPPRHTRRGHSTPGTGPHVPKRHQRSSAGVPDSPAALTPHTFYFGLARSSFCPAQQEPEDFLLL